MDEKSYLDDLPQRDAAHDIEKAAINAFENAITEAGLEIAAQGPLPEAPSAAKTIELYLESLKK